MNNDLIIGYVPNALPSKEKSLDIIAFQLERIADAIEKIAGFNNE